MGRGPRKHFLVSRTHLQALGATSSDFSVRLAFDRGSNVAFLLVGNPAVLLAVEGGFANLLQVLLPVEAEVLEIRIRGIHSCRETSRKGFELKTRGFRLKLEHQMREAMNVQALEVILQAGKTRKRQTHSGVR